MPRGEGIKREPGAGESNDWEPVDSRIIRGLVWIAAFSFAIGLFLSLTLLLRDLPPTPPVAIGRITVERASKLHDYAAALLFFAIVAPATIVLERIGARELERLRSASRRRELVSFLFVAPFLLAPFLYLTTFKWGWPLLIPLAIAELAPAAVIAHERTRWIRRILRREMWPFHALIIVESLAWVLFRYIVVGRRIAHIPTLFLEIVFVLFIVIIFWCALLAVARVAAFTIGAETEIAFQRLAIAAMPLVVLPVMALAFVPGAVAMPIVFFVTIAAMFVALRGRERVNARTVRGITAYAIIPILLYCASYASTASLTQWIDLFHRGESLGPASDYLRGKVPYRDVFVLHGLLDDGMLDAWLMRLFGRNLDVALMRPVVLGSFAPPALWYLGMAIFDSIPLAALAVLLGALTTTDNERVLFEVVALAILLVAIRRNTHALFHLAGIVAAVALFFSLDIGLYAIGGSILTLLVLRRWRDTAAFVAGVIIGALPFAIYLAVRGALGPFFTTLFVVIPRIIDAVWSLPFPDLTTTFRRDLNLHTISDFFLSDKFRFVLNPLVIGISLVCLWSAAAASRDRRKDENGRAASPSLHIPLLALTAFAILTQRSALGRADFPHQYFSAFLIGPMILILLVYFWRAAGTIATIVLIPFLFVVLWVPDIANGRLDDTIHYLGRVSGIGFVDPAAAVIRHRIDQVRYFVTDLSPRGAPIFDFSNQPAFYFFCDRPNPTRFYQVPILSPPEFQRETILALDRARPPIVIRKSPEEYDVFDGIDNSIRAQAVAAYINDYYSFAATTWGVEIWTRNRAAPARLNLDGYMRQIRLPSLKELGVLGERARLVFPSVGSLPGANGTYWKSDLMLHNPFSERVSLAVRYVSGDFDADRYVTLGAGQSIRWEDVTRTLFRAPEGRGAIWIEYRGVPPVARVKTYDAAHNARASVIAPMSMRDAAKELILSAIPSGSERRVNLGLVNIGETPASFRLTVHARSGQRVGGMIQRVLTEDELWSLEDAEKALGVSIDETMTVRVTVDSGAAVAFASIVDANGDSQFLAAVPVQ
ncbi:MAG TPA: hypothetical protein VL284_19020 [Thermoanaerobaculia bacterium]|nr:hypothetical protein [Thermoanaerobaculia bacterium]